MRKIITAEAALLPSGAPVARARTRAQTAFFDSTDPLTVGAYGVGGSVGPLDAEVYYAELYDGIDGTLVERFDPADADPDPSTFTSATSGATVTINRTTSASYHVEVAELDVAAIQTDGGNDYAVVIGDDSVGDVDAVVVPGGFAHGDYLRPGAIARFSPMMQSITSFAAARPGRPASRQCNPIDIILGVPCPPSS